MALGRPERGEDNRQDPRAGVLASLGFVGALSLSSLGCTDDPHAEDSTTDNTTMPDDGEEEMGDADTQDTGADMMNEVPPSTPDITSPLSVELDNETDKTWVTGEVDPSQGVEAVLVIDAKMMQEGQALPPAMDMADLNLESGEFTYSAGLGEYVFVAKAATGLQSTPSPMVEVVWDDPCEEVMCGPNGTCVEGACDCDEGYDDVEGVCEDITAPDAPVITSYDGYPFGSFDPVFPIEGGCPSDSYKVYYKIDKWLAPQGVEVEEGEWTQISDFIPGSTHWSVTMMPPDLETYDFYVRVEDEAGNLSEMDLTHFSRIQ